MARWLAASPRTTACSRHSRRSSGSRSTPSPPASSPGSPWWRSARSPRRLRATTFPGGSTRSSPRLARDPASTPSEHELFRTGDLRNESRWPRFSARGSEETGVCSILALRLFVEDDTMGALNLYSTKGDAFDTTDVALGKAFAANAAVAVLAARREEQLEHKAQTRSVIGQAMGIIMARSGVSADEAFEMLRAASQRTNDKLVDVAQRIVEQRPPEQPAR
ncbi:MAG TPA: GAF and ANTAR domain-containing protein [Acidimicrobiales bacterium]|nr:GAF and ANTAR domain-containing protein [Acidimicrobiales bacterium]